jgi:small GTP-binding protein
MQKKVCLLGAFAVGKTSLTDRFVTSTFCERYRTTVGVRIQKGTVSLSDQSLDLLIWDLAGEDEFVVLRPAYLRGSSGYILVADGTRPETLTRAIDLQRRAEEALGRTPFVLMMNKIDLSDDWAVDDAMLESVTQRGWSIFRTSAKTGQGIEQAFTGLARYMCYGENHNLGPRGV